MSRQTQSPLDVLKEGKAGDTPVCPRCGSEMRLRTARRGKNAGSQFYGCSTYPRCKGTRNVEVDEPEAKIEEPKTIKWSPYQVAIFDFIKGGQGNAVVEAVAGSGKSSTIVHGLKFTPKDAKVAFVAFNRHIAKELARRAPEHVSVSTLHSLGFGNIRRAFGRVKVEPYKVRNIVRDLAEAGSRATYDVIRTNY
jgi:transposase-like protein